MNTHLVLSLETTCTPLEESSQCMAKPIQCCKVKYSNYLILNKETKDKTTASLRMEKEGFT